MRILLVEDDPRLAEPLTAFLEQERHPVIWLSNGQAAPELLLQGHVDLVLLDWMLPGLDGLSIVRQLRGRGLDTLVLMITARDDLQDLVQGLGEGADDYLVKPFRMVELAARIRSLERRGGRPFQDPHLHWKQLHLSVAEGRASWGETPLVLTSRELRLLEWFLRHPQRLVSRGQLLDQLWSLDAEAGEDTVKTHLNNLRRKLRAACGEDPIENRHGLGYRLREETP
ncbi:MAG: response regulator transcription factor [Prochlorococcaceae cyanobacterium]|jgi:two-component system response regulator QseB